MMQPTTADSVVPSREPVIETTLLELVLAVNQVAASAADTEAVVRDLVGSGRVRLTGNFRGHPKPF